MDHVAPLSALIQKRNWYKFCGVGSPPTVDPDPVALHVIVVPGPLGLAGLGVTVPPVAGVGGTAEIVYPALAEDPCGVVGVSAVETSTVTV
jgi:hypothetical protein